MLLALDTSTEQLGVALTDGARCFEVSLPGGREQTTAILPLVAWMQERFGIAMDDIGAVAVATGPGSFTGLRVGLSVAKGLALARGCALIGVPTLDVAAWPYRAVGCDLIAVLPAGRSRFVWARYGAGSPHGGAPANVNRAELIATVAAQREALVVGELPGELATELIAVGASVLPPMQGTRRPAALAELAWPRWQAGETDDPATLEPLYLHGVQTALTPRSQRTQSPTTT